MKNNEPQDFPAPEPALGGPDRTRPVVVGPALDRDAAGVLAVQRAAFAKEARLYQDWNLPALVQTLEEMRTDIRTMTVLAARVGGLCVGSVRARAGDGVCHIGRLVVAPPWWGRGIGSRLMEAIEACFPDAAAFSLFTGSRSHDNLRFYENRGYRIVGHETVSDRLTLVHMRRPAGPRDPGASPSSQRSCQ